MRTDRLKGISQGSTRIMGTEELEETHQGSPRIMMTMRLEGVSQGSTRITVTGARRDLPGTHRIMGTVELEGISPSRVISPHTQTRSWHAQAPQGLTCVVLLSVATKEQQGLAMS